MLFPSRVRKLILTVHVVSTVGWLGAVIVFLALAGIGLSAADPATVRGAYLVMDPAARLVLIPLALLSALSGLLQSLGTQWGLFRHYWVVFKLLITLVAIGLLLLYMETFARMAAVAAEPEATLEAVRNASPALHAALALGGLGVATVLAIYKPRGLTPYGWRRLRETVMRPPGAES